ncbi:carbohydrate-binding module family 18 protein [Cladorrhinum samala]|uniref:Carbohydrate-binding module family 18 protein n=1 Tax=Cladorrhinum samala TaxID=585594 RepID=A0AAV9HKF6_9PEZI|nr:carbohydrate-binding module family 18 protein [Cladorrhinum samala]
MLSSASILLLLSSALLPLTSAVVSPNKTCGLLLAGSNNGYTCPGDAACCSQYGYCGTGDNFCLTPAPVGCQSRYSNSTAACYAPKNGTTVSVDGTCGNAGAGKNGYKCPASGSPGSCCSASGYCGSTAEHCAAASGCQPGFGTCTGRAPRRSRNLWQESEVEQELEQE